MTFRFASRFFPSLAIAAIAVAPVPAGERGVASLNELLNETFDTAGASSNFTVVDGTTGGVGDFSATFGFDYSTLTIAAPGTAVDATTIPEAPSTPGGAAATRGLATQVNLTGAGRKTVDVFTNMDFTTDIEVQVDVFYYHDNNSGSTEDPVVGLYHSGTLPIQWQTISAAITDPTDGYFFKAFGDIDVGGADYYFFEGGSGQLLTGAGALPGITWGDGLEADNPGRDAAGNALFTDNISGYPFGATTPGGAFRWVWQTVKIRSESGIVTVRVNDALIASYNDPDDTFDMGKVLLAHEDAFAGANTGNYVIFDNLIVSEVVPPPAARDWEMFE